MTPEEFSKLLTYISENNAWGIKMYEVIHKRNRKAVKYVDVTFDSRTGRIGDIRFWDGCMDVRFGVDCQDDIDRIYRWLDEPLNKRSNNDG